MEPIYFTMTKIWGDYGYMISDAGVENMVALALLPDFVEVGDRLKMENFEYTLC
ncbi:MAG: hypothetical protein R3Y62_03755 [Eubacteriales bacterium]